MDITPCSRGSQRRVFLVDGNATYDFQNEGFRRDNIRIALSDEHDIDDLRKAAKRRNGFITDSQA